MNPEILNKILATANESMNRWEESDSKETALVQAVFYHCERARVLFDFVGYKNVLGGLVPIISAAILYEGKEYAWLDYSAQRHNHKWLVARV